jgi:chitinase
VFDYKALPLPGAEERYDEEARASYSYDPARRHLVTYDTPRMASEKAEWIKKNGLGGAMWWESSADKVGEQSLVGTVVGVLGSLEFTKNCVEYPHSKFENVRKGFMG